LRARVQLADAGVSTAMPCVTVNVWPSTVIVHVRGDPAAATL
jgi:hypothetical protein